MPSFPVDDLKNGDEGVVLDEPTEWASEPADSSCSSSGGGDKPRHRQHRGPSTLWDDGQEWILIFDRLLNSAPARRSAERECGCEPRVSRARECRAAAWSGRSPPQSSVRQSSRPGF